MIQPNFFYYSHDQETIKKSCFVYTVNNSILFLCATKISCKKAVFIQHGKATGNDHEKRKRRSGSS